MNKSSGIDVISPFVLNECNNSVNIPISLIFSKSFELGKVPPIPKKGSQTNPSNYRPIMGFQTIHT
jgi:hypothetical protein